MENAKRQAARMAAGTLYMRAVRRSKLARAKKNRLSKLARALKGKRGASRRRG